MTRTASVDGLESERLDTDVHDWEQAWVDDEFAAIVAANWQGEPPTPTFPGNLPPRWNRPEPWRRPEPRRWPAARRLAPASRGRQRSPPTSTR